MRHLSACLAFALAGIAAPPAAALTCYMVLDRSDNVVYRDTYPPIDLSSEGTAERDALRGRGEHLIAMEADRCLAVQFFTGTAGSPALSVDEVVGGMAVGSTAALTGPSGTRAKATTRGAAVPASARSALPGPSQTKRR